MTPQSLISEMARVHGIDAASLSSATATWDMDVLIAAGGNIASVTVDGIAADLAARATKIVAQQAKIEARASLDLTPAARATPQFACTRCDGKGHIRGFGHIDGGKCFACNGAGTRRPRH